MKVLNEEMLDSLLKILVQMSRQEFSLSLRMLVNQVSEILRVERCSIFRVIEEAEKFRLVAGIPKEGHGIGMEFSFEDLPLLKEALEKRSAILIEEPAIDPRTEKTRELIRDKKINAILVVPLVVEKVVGMIVVDASKEKKSFTPQEIHFVETLSYLIGLLFEREQRVEKANHKKVLFLLGRAAAEAAHRLRNPLVTIGGYAKMLWETLSGEEQEKARIIMEKTKELEELVNHLLQFSGQQTNFKLAEISLNEIVKCVEEIAREMINQSGKRILLKIKTEPLPVSVVDSQKIQEAIVEIVRNAIEAMKEGEIVLRTRQRGDRIYISITNTGCIEEEILQQIFNPFFTTKPKGAGLGLAIAQKNILQHGGEIKVEVDNDLQFTTFTIELPQII